jgi:PAS domain S-box-containing protein
MSPDEKTAKEAQQKSKERYRLLLKNAHDMIFVHGITENGYEKFLKVNDNICTTPEYTQKELLAMTVRDIDVFKQFDRIPAIIKRLIKEGHTVFETGFLTKDKERIPVEVSARLIDLLRKQTVLAIIRDITGRKAAELQLQHNNLDQLDGTIRLNRSDGTLFTMVLHEKEPRGEI